MGKATQDLRNEHHAILHVLKILDKMMVNNTKEAGVMLQYYHELANFLKVFADKCHHGKEEIYLFAALNTRGVADDGPVGELLQEHKQAREYIEQMVTYLETKDLSGFNTAAAKYRDLLRSHIEKENAGLFITADRLLDAAVQDELFEKFEQHEEKVIGHGVHEELHAMIHRWANEFGV